MEIQPEIQSMDAFAIVLPQTTLGSIVLYPNPATLMILDARIRLQSLDINPKEIVSVIVLKSLVCMVFYRKTVLATAMAQSTWVNYAMIPSYAIQLISYVWIMEE